MRLTFLILLLLTFISSFSQKGKRQTESYHVFNSNWEPCPIENAVYLSYERKINDSTYLVFNYHFSGPLLSIETYKDESYTILNGLIAYYDNEGLIDSSGYTKNGKRDKTWYYYDDTLGFVYQKDYQDGKLIKETDLIAKRKEDSLNKKIPDGFEKDEKEAEFKGGAGSWIKYLQKNIQFPKRAESLNKSGQVRICFYVNTDGSIGGIYVLKSIEFSLDKEAWRLIEESPRWEPAIQGDKKVKAYRIQPITFAY